MAYEQPNEPDSAPTEWQSAEPSLDEQVDALLGSSDKVPTDQVAVYRREYESGSPEYTEVVDGRSGVAQAIRHLNICRGISQD